MCVPYWLAIGVHESVNNTAPPSMSLLVLVVPMGADRNRSAILRGRGEGRRGEGRGGERRGGGKEKGGSYKLEIYSHCHSSMKELDI